MNVPEGVVTVIGPRVARLALRPHDTGASTKPESLHAIGPRYVTAALDLTIESRQRFNVELPATSARAAFASTAFRCAWRPPFESSTRKYRLLISHEPMSVLVDGAGPRRCGTTEAIVFFDEFPVSEGHTPGVPRRHVNSNLRNCRPTEQDAVWRIVGTVRTMLIARYGVESFHIGMNDKQGKWRS